MQSYQQDFLEDLVYYFSEEEFDSKIISRLLSGIIKDNSWRGEKDIANPLFFKQ